MPFCPKMEIELLEMSCFFKKLDDGHINPKRRLCWLTLVMLCSLACLHDDLVMQALVCLGMV